MTKWINDVWHFHVAPYVKSKIYPNKYRNDDNTYTNVHGVHLVTGNTLKSYMSNHHHTLLLLYSPMCGHCKRVNVIWNQLAQLTKEFSDWNLQIARLDVTSNDYFYPGMVTPYLPELYYSQPYATGEPIRYNRTDDIGDRVGGIDDPIQVIDWWIEVATTAGHDVIEALEQSVPPEEEEDEVKEKVNQETENVEKDDEEVIELE